MPTSSSTRARAVVPAVAVALLALTGCGALEDGGAAADSAAERATGAGATADEALDRALGRAESTLRDTGELWESELRAGVCEAVRDGSLDSDGAALDSLVAEAEASGAPEAVVRELRVVAEAGDRLAQEAVTALDDASCA